MEKKTLSALNALLTAVAEDPRLLALSEDEQRLSEDEEFVRLSHEKDAKADSFEETRRHYGGESEEAKKALHELYLAKKSMDEHPLARTYESHYKQVRELFDEMDRIVFDCFRGKPNCGGCHDSH